MLFKLNILITYLGSRRDLPDGSSKLCHRAVIIQDPEWVGLPISTPLRIIRRGSASSPESAGICRSTIRRHLERLGHEWTQARETCADDSCHWLDACKGPQSSLIVEILPLVAMCEDNTSKSNEAGARYVLLVNVHWIGVDR